MIKVAHLVDSKATALTTFAIFFPLLMPWPGLANLGCRVLGYNITSTVAISLLCLWLITLLLLLSERRGHRTLPTAFTAQVRAMTLFFAFFGLLGLTQSFFSGNPARTLVQLMYIVVPYYYANAILAFGYRNGACFSRVLRYGTLATLIYLVVVLAYNVVTYSLFTSGSALYAPGGQVVLGYTIVILASLVFLAKEECGSFWWYKVTSVLLMVCCVLTQSRVATWATLTIGVLCLIPRRRADLALLFVLGAIILVFALDPFGIIFNYSERLYSIDSGRFNTWDGVLSCFSESNAMQKSLGYGLGNVFPVLDWQTGLQDQSIIRGDGDGSWNSFFFNGHSLLVEPHNAFLWLLLETGLVGVVAFAFIVLFIGTRSIKHRNHYALAGFLVAAAFTVVNLFDAIIFCNAISASWWCILLLPIFYSAASKGAAK